MSRPGPARVASIALGAAGGSAAAFVLATAVSFPPMPDDVTRLVWYAIRVAGIGAYLALWLTTVAGLCLSGQVGGRLGAVFFPVHRLGDLALSLAGLHALLLLGDRFAGFTPFTLVMPFASEYRPLATGAGILAFYLSVAAMWSVHLRPRIGYAAWQRIHASAALAYGLALAHGLAAGTDSGADALRLTYLLTGGTVAGLVVLRLRQVLRRAGPERAPALRRAAADS